MTSTLPPALARLHLRVRTHPGLGRFTLANRLLLAMAFLPTGLVKLLGQRFTVLPLEHPVGFFFEAMYRTGPWWHFIGAVQVGAALCLLLPATATLGALLFLPVALSVLLITWGVGFGGTVWVAGGMVLSAIYLLCWDADRIWEAAARVLGPAAGPPLMAGAGRIECAGWVLGGAAGLGLFLVTRNLLPSTWAVFLLGSGLVAGVLVPVGWVLAWRSGVGTSRTGQHTRPFTPP